MHRGTTCEHTTKGHRLFRTHAPSKQCVMHRTTNTTGRSKEQQGTLMLEGENSTNTETGGERNNASVQRGLRAKEKQRKGAQSGRGGEIHLSFSSPLSPSPSTPPVTETVREGSLIAPASTSPPCEPLPSSKHKGSFPPQGNSKHPHP